MRIAFGHRPDRSIFHHIAVLMPQIRAASDALTARHSIVTALSVGMVRPFPVARPSGHLLKGGAVRSRRATIWAKGTLRPRQKFFQPAGGQITKTFGFTHARNLDGRIKSRLATGACRAR
jgi:hypothetical protein